MKKLIIMLLIICLATTVFAQKIALIGAMDSEIELLKNSMKNVTEVKIGAITYYEGILEGKNIVLLKTGVGKVNAAIGADTVIREFEVESIIFTGVAGAIDNKLNIADIVISKDLVQHDVDLTAFGRPMGLIPGNNSIEFKADKNLIDIAYESAVKVLGKDKVKIGRIATGDQFIADKDRVKMIGEIFEASAVEMEGGAVAQVAQLYNVPFVVLRAVSDKADGSAKMTYEDFVVVAADNSANIVKEMLKRIK
ncbi:5'-methylthioadenosine/adenosylhomocysteine nucleosidase [Fusobacterium varium]|jgi:adenosylhomocysteine nucleosidase|uniref:5'-methylthioadenosine/adenosylhomocysteine nucleosidase n=1 Tax=Fusobacterium varium TaxID=856 RepID=UPI000E420B18|nr:5'-methylthioadenosine/adenosylhomocysteine nucleosidase [Fusobacterium varium]MCI6032348.1 5'-methylthioadenosine/adenosylhomocysteine nucleosidase [Fusobacterium varium]RGJ30623.1 5'-methylthioadenosine/adenosylhomocysteine nucleosidase [Fusobacterium varium]